MYIPVTDPNDNLQLVSPADTTQELLVALKNFQLLDVLFNEEINETLYNELVTAINTPSKDNYLTAINALLDPMMS